MLITGCNEQMSGKVLNSFYEKAMKQAEMFSDISECGTVYTFIKELKKRSENLKYVKKPPCRQGGQGLA